MKENIIFKMFKRMVHSRYDLILRYLYNMTPRLSKETHERMVIVRVIKNETPKAHFQTCLYFLCLYFSAISLYYIFYLCHLNSSLCSLFYKIVIFMAFWLAIIYSIYYLFPTYVLLMGLHAYVSFIGIQSVSSFTDLKCYG